MKYIGCSACVLCLLISVSLYSISSKRKIALSYNNLNVEYSIIGPLGVELGKVIDLEVEKIKLNEKSDPPTLTVRAISGKKLEKTINCKYRMLIIDDKFEYGKTYKIKAYQDGYFTGTPYEVLKELMFQTTDYYFDVALVVFKYIK
jgi:hypothetical protein